MVPSSTLVRSRRCHNGIRVSCRCDDGHRFDGEACGCCAASTTSQSFEEARAFGFGVPRAVSCVRSSDAALRWSGSAESGAPLATATVRGYAALKQHAGPFKRRAVPIHLRPPAKRACWQVLALLDKGVNPNARDSSGYWYRQHAHVNGRHAMPICTARANSWRSKLQALGRVARVVTCSNFYWYTTNARTHNLARTRAGITYTRACTRTRTHARMHKRLDTHAAPPAMRWDRVVCAARSTTLHGPAGTR